MKPRKLLAVAGRMRRRRSLQLAILSAAGPDAGTRSRREASLRWRRARPQMALSGHRTQGASLKLSLQWSLLSWWGDTLHRTTLRSDARVATPQVSARTHPSLSAFRVAPKCMLRRASGAAADVRLAPTAVAGAAPARAITRATTIVTTSLVRRLQLADGATSKDGPVPRIDVPPPLHRRRTAREAVAAREMPNVPAAVGPPRVEMVWRKPTSPTEPTAPIAATRSVSCAIDAMPRAAPSALESTPVPRVARAATLAAIDPALVDRLADDVIRRVERQVRIERERRGL